MPGVKGKSGGSREGAGRKQQRFTLKRGDRLVISVRTPDGVLPMQPVTVGDMRRNEVTLLADDGDRITIFR